MIWHQRSRTHVRLKYSLHLTSLDINSCRAPGACLSRPCLGRRWPGGTPCFKHRPHIKWDLNIFGIRFMAPTHYLDCRTHFQMHIHIAKNVCNWWVLHGVHNTDVICFCLADAHQMDGPGVYPLQEVYPSERRLELRGPPLGDGHSWQCSLPRCSSWKTVSPPVGRVQDEQAKTLHSSYVSICFLEIQLGVPSNLKLRSECNFCRLWGGEVVGKG